jgi:hypothetical protein
MANGNPGGVPGGGGSGGEYDYPSSDGLAQSNGWGGGGGGYASKTYTQAQLSGNVPVVVGTGGSGGHADIGPAGGGAGARGAVSISWTAANTSYGPVASNTTGAVSGYAWGSDVVGWVDFSLATTDYRSCTPGTTYSCVDSTTLRQTTTSNTCGVTTSDSACSYLCSGSGCVPPPAPQFAGSGVGGGHLKVAPSVVRSGATTRVFWDVQYVSSCTISGGGDSWSGASAGCNSSTHECTAGPSGIQSSAITTRRTYTLTCTGLDSSTLTETQTVNLVPTYQEL